jgi:Ca2+-binding EF-hand superfamily protein
LLRTITKLQALNDNQDQLQEQVERYFKEFDKDKNGYLDRQELAEFLV